MKKIGIKLGTDIDKAKETALKLVESTAEVYASTLVKIRSATTVERLNQVIQEHFSEFDIDAG